MSYAINNVMKDVRVKLIAFSIILVFSMLTSVSAWAATTDKVPKAIAEPVPKTYTDVLKPQISFDGATKVYYTTTGKAVVINKDGTAGGDTMIQQGSSITIDVDETTVIKAVGTIERPNSKDPSKTDIIKSPAFSGTYKVVLPAPTFSVKSGPYKEGQSVALGIPVIAESPAVSGNVEFYYTKNPKAPVDEFIKYNEPITVSSTQTIRAYMVKGDLPKSKIVSAKYTITLPTPKIEKSSKTFTTITTTEINEPEGYSGGAIYYTTNGDTPVAEENDTCRKYIGTAVPIQAASMTLKAIYTNSGAISKMVSATYKINLASPKLVTRAGTLTDNTKLVEITAAVGDIYYTTDKTVPTAIPVLQQDGTLPAPWKLYSESIMLTDNQTFLKAVAVSSGVVSKVVAGTYTVNLPIPVFDPRAGKLADSGLVTLKTVSSLAGADIYYTTDPVVGTTVAVTGGSATVNGTPTSTTTTNWRAYPSTGILVTTTPTTIKAIVVKSNIASKVASATYTINLPTVRTNVPARSYTTPQFITLSAGTDAVITYTLNGSVPSTTVGGDTAQFTPNVSAPIVINKSTVIKAIATKGGISSAVVSYPYTINLPSITFNPTGGFVAPNSKISITNTSFPKGTTIYYKVTKGGTIDAALDPINASYALANSPALYDPAVGIIPTGSAGEAVFVKAVALLNGATYSKITTGSFKIENAQTLTSDMAARTISAPATAQFTGAPSSFTVADAISSTTMVLNTDYTYDVTTKKITLTTAGFLVIAAKTSGDVTMNVTAGGRNYTGKIVLADKEITAIYNPGTTAVTSVTVTGNKAGTGSKYWIVDTSTPKNAVLGTTTSGLSTTSITIPSTLFTGNVSAFNVVSNKIFKSPTVAVADFAALTIDMLTQTMTKEGVTTTAPSSVVIGGTSFIATTDYQFSTATITFTKAGILKLAAMPSGSKAVSVVCDGVTVIGSIIVSDAPTGITLQNPGTAGNTEAVVATGNTTAGAKYIVMNGTASTYIMGTTGSDTTVENIVVNPAVTFVAGDLSAYYVTPSTLHKPLKVTVAANPYAEVALATTVVGLQAPVTGVDVTTATGTPPVITWAEGAASFKPSLTMKNSDSTATIAMNGTDKWVWEKTSTDVNLILKEVSSDGTITLDDTKATDGRLANVKATLKDSTGTKTRLNKSNTPIVVTVQVVVDAKANSFISAGTFGTLDPNTMKAIKATNTFIAGTGTNNGSTIDKSIELAVAGTKSLYGADITLTRADNNSTVKYYVGSKPTSDSSFNGVLGTVNNAVISGKIQTDLNLNDVVYLLVQNVTSKTYYKLSYKLAPTAAAVNPITTDAAGVYTGGKKIIIKFSQPVKAENITTTNLGIADATGGTNVAVTPQTGYSDSFMIALGTDATIAADEEIVIAAANVVTADGIPASSDITFTVPNPPAAAAVAAGDGPENSEPVATDNEDGVYVATNTITIKFSMVVDSSKVTLANLGLADSAAASYAGGAGAAIASGAAFRDTYVITLGVNPKIKAGDVITIAAENVVNNKGITAVAPINFSVLYVVEPAAVNGGTGATAITTDATGGTYSAGETITIHFTQPVEVDKITPLANLTLAGNGTPALQTTSGALVEPLNAVGGYAKSFKITLGNTPTLAEDDTITIDKENVTNPDGVDAADDVVFTVPATVS